MKNILSKDITNQYTAYHDPVFEEINRLQQEIEEQLVLFNYSYHTPEARRQLLSTMLQEPIDETVTVLPPFHTDFGKHITFGKHIFINRDVMFTDLGGISIGNHVLIGPRANILTVNHPLNPSTRRGVIVEPIIIKDNAWIGAGATILPGVTIGRNAIIAANATVTKDVPDNVVVAGPKATFLTSVVED